MFVLVSVVCGLLVTAAALPFVGGAAWGAKAARDGMSSLPLAFDTPAQAQRSRVLDADGKVLAYFYDQNRSYVKLANIAPVMRTAIVSIEDHRFYEHGPLDAQGTLRAFVKNFFAGGVTQGGSTLTQQYVKQVQVNEAAQAGDKAAVEAATDSSYQRKLRELRYAVSVEDSDVQGPDPRALPEHRLLRRRGVRRRGRLRALLRHHGQEADARRRPRCSPAWCRTRTAFDPVAHRERRHRAPQRRARPDGRARHRHRDSAVTKARKATTFSSKVTS